MSLADRLRPKGGALGRLVSAEEPGFLEAVRSRLAHDALRGASGHRRTTVLGRDVHEKFGPLRGKARLRHGARGVLLRAPAPRLAEFANLAWLRRNGFGAPRPLAAGAWSRGGLPHFQFLVTEHVEAPTLAELGALAGDPRRAPALRELGFELARLHARGFVHRDLFPRNLLVAERGGEPLITFLDAWRGGRGFALRGPAYDLACFFLEAPALFEAREQGLFLGAYLAERVVLGKPVREGFLAAVARERRALVRRTLARIARGSPVPAPVADWQPPEPVPASSSRR